jgi:pSer/pThr/pTyr-binding forkhead associated (FHA) protein
MPRIQLTTPDGASLEFEIPAGRSRIGRAEDNDIVIPDGSVSSYHGEITLTDSGIHVHDRGSTNGTHVGGQRVEEADIAWGGAFMLGNCKTVLVGDEAAEPEASEEPAAEAPASEPEEEIAEAPSYASSTPATVITGLGATPCPSSMRRGFGAKAKEKDSVGSMVMLLGVVGLLACGAAAFMIMQMGA